MATIDRKDPRYLTGPQQQLLRAALASNNPTAQTTAERVSTKMAAIQNPYAANQSLQGPDVLNNFDFDADLSGYLDGDTSFDFEASEFAGLNGADVKETHDKRKASDDDDDDDNDAKRGEGDDKQPKKPGRKPLTSEPTTKRKAQNRAAQRAFRERKEKHLKDLETKVEQLTKTSETEKQENGALRAQVQRLQSELKEYKRRLATDGNRRSQPSLANGITMPNRNEFAFEFPVFGSLPGAPAQIFGNGNGSGTGPPLIKREGSGSPTGAASTSRHNSASQSPANRNDKVASPSGPNGAHRNDSQASSGVQTFAGLFSPSLLNGVATSANNSPDYGFPRASNSPKQQQDNGTDTNSGLSRVFRFNSESATSNTDSPSQSSMSNFNATSSCNTSPAPSHPSPPKDVPSGNPGLTTLSTPSTLNGIDWLASQNGGGFDPVLFGDYRESQDAIVGDGEFNNGFFNEAFPFDFGSPLNFGVNSPKSTANTVNSQRVAPNPANVKTAAQEKSAACQKLLSQVEKCSGGDEDYSSATVNPSNVTGAPGAPGTLLSANTIWNQLQSNKDFQDGKFDLDGLCSELRAKAKCSESGVVVPASDVDVAFKKMCGKGNPPGDYPNQDPNLVWNEPDVDQAISRLGGEKVNWGGFGLN
ncbi:AP-1-like transcription factor [Sphaceloma murrayae]|uniref:AP-1-like transcription factor n=1 Tax=Sphaceloma murrayae TaxID=2082308 RepID=A0A2K1QIR1_9PEZI|nr:AP-1-like transcription factor [Sphaceloma murrayae]